MYMSEDYNSPQSVYWCLKPFIAVGIPENHPFWTSEELPHPMLVSASLNKPPSVALLWPPRHILCNTAEHHFLLSSGQFTRWNHKAREAKYGKFAYSSAFGFSVPVGPSVEQLAPDSTLCLSLDNGDSWKVRWEPFDIQSGTLEHEGQTIPTLSSVWKPWKNTGLHVHTTLVAPVRKWPGWHLRIHEICLDCSSNDRRRLEHLRCFDSSFAISAQTSTGSSIYEQPCNETMNEANEERQSWWKDSNSCLVISESGAVGTIDLTGKFLSGQHAIDDPLHKRLTLDTQSVILKPNANTNLMAQRTLIPSIHHSTDLGNNARTKGNEADRDVCASYYIVTGVFAVERSAQALPSAVWDMWRRVPSGKVVFSPESRAKLILD
jgi:hypothetical protein